MLLLHCIKIAKCRREFEIEIIAQQDTITLKWETRLRVPEGATCIGMASSVVSSNKHLLILFQKYSKEDTIEIELIEPISQWKKAFAWSILF
jgi:hypothetical protein